MMGLDSGPSGLPETLTMARMGSAKRRVCNSVVSTDPCLLKPHFVADPLCVA